MATITINIADGDLARVVADICEKFNYQAVDVNGIPNPETKAQFARRMLITTVKGWCADVESSDASATAIINAVNSANQLGIT